MGFDLKNAPASIAPTLAAMLGGPLAGGLNALADAGDIAHITRKINGGVNGLVDRETRYAKAMETLA